MEPLVMRILRGCGVGSSWENKDATSRIHKPKGRRHTRWNWERRGIRCIINHMNGINDDVLKVNCGNGDNGSRILGLCGDGSHWLDTLSVSNSSNRNGNSWFVTLIASLNIMAKMFAKIAKTFVGLSATIIAISRRPILIFHLEAKFAKMDFKNEIYAKTWVRSTWTAKCQLWPKVNGQT